MGSYVRHIHCKDRTFEKKKGEDPKITLAGREMFSSSVETGCIPMRQILEYFIEAGYDATLAIEHFGSKHQLEDMKKSAEWLLNITKNVKRI